MQGPVADWLVPWIVWGKDLQFGEDGVGGWCVEEDGSRECRGFGAEGWQDEGEESGREADGEGGGLHGEG